MLLHRLRVVLAKGRLGPIGRTISRYYSEESCSNGVQDEILVDKFSNLRQDYKSPRYPVVLCHGFFGFDKLEFFTVSRRLFEKPRDQGKVEEAIKRGLIHFDYWRGITEALNKIGSKVMIAKVPPFGTVEERAGCLHRFLNEQSTSIRREASKLGRDYEQHKENISNEFDKGSLDSMKHKPLKVNLIAHSMGGLDCRFLISKFKDKQYQVMSLTTISTPHHGSECADFIVDLVGKKSVLYSLLPASISELTTTKLKLFNQEIQNDPNVAYFSYGARFTPRMLSFFKPTWELMRYMKRKKKGSSKWDQNSDNDGLVSVESAKWGTYLGTLDQVDHLDLINWTNKVRLAVDEVLYKKTTNFNAIALYLDIADNLHKKDF